VAAERLLPSPGEIAFGADLIAGRIDELARQISGDYRGRDLVLVTVLKGSAIFLADLSRRLTIPHRLDFIAISAYRGASAGSSGRIRLLKDIDRPVRDCDVLIVEDVVDTGLTLGYIYRDLELRRPASLKVCILFDRPHRRLVDIPID
jgi:hypoxanthine phosphoribosyltransferase